MDFACGIVRTLRETLEVGQRARARARIGKGEFASVLSFLTKRERKIRFQTNVCHRSRRRAGSSRGISSAMYSRTHCAAFRSRATRRRRDVPRIAVLARRRSERARKHTGRKKNGAVNEWSRREVAIPRTPGIKPSFLTSKHVAPALSTLAPERLRVCEN